MNEIEKMYKNAGIDYEERYNNCTLNKEGECNLKCSCDICKYSEEIYIYPTFTAEKQLKICKLLLKLEHSISYYFYENRYGFVIDDKQDDCIEAEKFEIALAMIVNALWQDLTEAEHKQIKEILE